MDDGSHAIYLSMVDECLCFVCDLSVTTVEGCMNLFSHAIPLSLSLPCFYTMYFYLRSQKPRRNECKQTSKRKGYILVAYLNFFSFFFLFSFSLRVLVSGVSLGC
ncbi:hypothetical protein BDQ94DRAFT_6604 [Aspergillus welwitschiae]|uniref:Uncharacterized protein n=1 Tax=Aspergillus welwitschiae TaxID=1341132 RepID=A0A3F3QK51_9EURO|nr:hypothetical protein BDQ94DRAFT_6604 [Aspergillus welwitschiae]RDH39571.1 hypothetical protein BDQ94DRAFT_6604 [Aspergillus welwitschiae]